MKYQNQHSNNHSSQITKLIAIFSILFASVFFIAILLSEDKGLVTAKAMPGVSVPVPESSLVTVSEEESEDTVTYTDISTDEPETTKQSGTSSSISNYVNAWKLSKVTPVSQIIA